MSKDVINCCLSYLYFLQILLLVYLVPVFARLAGLPVQYLSAVHNFSSCFVLFLTVMYIFVCLPHVLKFVRDTYFSITLKLELYGAVVFAVMIFKRLFVPVQVLLFWLSMYGNDIYFSVLSQPADVIDKEELPVASAALPPLPYTLLLSAAKICYNPMLVVATCTAVGYLSRAVLFLAQWFVMGNRAHPRPRDLSHNGVTEGATMFLLSLQTSLYQVEMPDRFSLFTVILLIVLSSLIQSTYELIEPPVLALSAQGIAPLYRHLRICSMCIILFCLPMYMVYMFTLLFEQDFWLLLVVSTSVMTAVQVVGLFSTYCLLTYDALCAQDWPGLDDVVYYSRATTRVFEFFVAVFVVCAGIKETLAGQWTPMNIIVLVIHCYFNVFQRLQLGWKSFLLRLEAARKISGLPNATNEKLESYNDVCSICYADLDNACVVTACHHIFHPPCLRKWLYVQDKCPLCQTSITVPDHSPQQGTSPVEEGNTPSINLQESSSIQDVSSDDYSDACESRADMGDSGCVSTSSAVSPEASGRPNSPQASPPSRVSDDVQSSAAVSNTKSEMLSKFGNKECSSSSNGDQFTAIEEEVGATIPLIEESEEEQ